MDDAVDIGFMRAALDVARTGLGRTAPNPSVGCVLVRSGQIIGQGRTSDKGKHAEVAALEQAGEKAEGATAYVTLEPCFKDDAPSCSTHLIKSGIRRVVIGCLDENPLIYGRGLAALQAAGIEVVTGCLEEDCREMNKGFFLAKTQARPLVSLKIALSLDGKIATRTGHSQWITGEDSRRRVHELRATHDAILTGIGTVLADDPALTARLDGVDHVPRRVVLDTQLRMPPKAKMINDAAGPVTIFTAKPTQRLGLSMVVTSPLSATGQVNLPFALSHLAANGVTRLMVEAGQGVFTSFLTSGLWDHLYIMRAPVVIGTDGRDAFGSLGVDDLAAGLRPVLQSREVLGDDLLEIYTPPVSP